MRNTDFTQKLKDLLIGKTQKELAKELSVTEDRMSRWVNGIEKPTSFKNCTAILELWNEKYGENL